jgi:hypothetical protein
MHDIDLPHCPDTALEGNANSATSQHKGIAGSIISSPLRLGVATIAAEDGRFPTPAIDEATGDELNLRTFQGDAHVTLAPWPFMSGGQRVWIELRDALSAYPVVSGYVVTGSDVGKPLSWSISRSMLEGMATDTLITVRAQVALNGSVEDRARLAYPMRTITLRKARPGWEDFESSALGEYRVFHSDAVFITAGGGTCYVEHAPAGMSGKALRVKFDIISREARTILNGQNLAATAVSFKYIAPIALTFFYRANGNLMSTPLPAGTRTFTMTGMSSTATTIITETPPVTFWLDDILFE